MSVLNGLNYEELRRALAELPLTWYPDLIMAMVEAAYEKEVFVKGGASRFIRRTEQRMKLTRPDLKSVRMALRLAIDYEDSFIEAHRTELKLIKKTGRVVSVIPKENKETVAVSKRRIAKWRKILAKIDQKLLKNRGGS